MRTSGFLHVSHCSTQGTQMKSSTIKYTEVVAEICFYFFCLLFSTNEFFYLTFNASIYSASFNFLLCPTLLSIVHLKSIFSVLQAVIFLLLMSWQKLGYWCQIEGIDPNLFLASTKSKRLLSLCCYYCCLVLYCSGQKWLFVAEPWNKWSWACHGFFFLCIFMICFQRTIQSFRLISWGDSIFSKTLKIGNITVC